MWLDINKENYINFAWQLFISGQQTRKLRLRESTNDWRLVLCASSGFMSLNARPPSPTPPPHPPPPCPLHKKILVSRQSYDKLALFKYNNTGHVRLFLNWSSDIFKLELSNYFPTYFLVDFYQNINCIRTLMNDHLPPLS